MSHQDNGILFTNGRFFDGSSSMADLDTSMVVKNGKIAYIGTTSSAEVKIYEDSGIQKKDLDGHHVLPGFIDGHMHFLMLGQSLSKVDLDGCKNLDEIRERIKKYAEENPSKKRILCMGWMHSMTGGEAKASTLDDLGNRPIYIDSKDLHSVWCNTPALQEMGIQEMPNPAGGTISRDSSGKAEGLLSEACVLLIVWPYLAKVLPMEEKVAALRAAINAYHAVGCTGFIDMAMDENAWDAVLAFRKAEGGTLPMRIAAHWCILPGSGESDRLAQVERAIELQRQFNEKMSPDLRILGIKIICDGVIDACTAALAQPYTSHPSSSLDPIWTPEMLGPVVKKACEAGLQCALHAIGDAAVHNAINVLEKHGKANQRHRVEHLELTAPEDAKRLGELGITASIQPVHSDPAILRAWPKLLGPERVKRAFAYKEFADHGAVLAIGSDSPTAPHAPLQNLYVGSTRKSARQTGAGDAPMNEHFKLGVAQAVRAATRGAAYSCFAEERMGKLEVGMEADFCVVEWSGEATGLLEAKVRETWFAGKQVFEA
jgi:predicted amidohydrolase YtcJ